MPTNGQTAIGPNGERAVYQNGQWVVMGAPAPQMPVNPDYQQKTATLPYAVPKAAADIANVQTNIEGNRIDNQVKAATAHAMIVKADADAKAAVATAQKATIEAEKAAAEGKPVDVNALIAARRDAETKLGLVKSLAERSHDWFATGFGSSVARKVDGSTASDIEADVGTLSGAGALQKVMQMASENGGKNPLTPLSEGDFKVIQQSVTNLNPSQSDENFRKNLGVYGDIYTRAIQGIDQQLAAAGHPIPGASGAQGGGNNPLQQFNGEAPQMGVANGSSYSTPDDMALSNDVFAAYKSGGGLRAMVAAAAKRGYQPNAQDIAGWQAAIDYHKKTGGYTGIEPRKTGVRGAVAQAFGSAAASPIGAGITGIADQLTMGGLDEAAGAVNSAFGGGSMADETAYANMGKQATRELNPGAYAAGQFGGGILQGAVAAPIAAAVPAINGAIGTMAGGSLYGAINGALEGNGDRASGAGGGAGAGLFGGLAGRYIAAPLAERAMRSQAGQAVSGAVRKGWNAIAPEAASVAPMANVPTFAAGERALPNMGNGFDGAISNLRDANRLGLPYALADADPKLRALGGTVARKSVNARDLAETTFEPRARGQAERAVDAINTHLAPVTDIAERSAQWRQAAQTASSPYYNAGMQRAAPVDDRVAAFLDTEAGKKAVKEAYSIASNEGRDPKAMGFDLNDQGEVVIKNLPSYETLDLVKRGFDQQLSQYRNPITGKLDLEGNPAAGALEGLRKRFVSTLDELNPDYKAARGAYSAEIKNRDALNMGFQGPDTRLKPRDLPRVTGALDPRAMGEYQRGYATKMGDMINDTGISRNPYDRVYGTTNQQAKLPMVFPNGAANFDRTYGLERDMAKTYNETLGGSQTAARQAADAQLGNLGVAMIDGVSNVATGGGFSAGTAAKLGLPMIKDAIKLGLGKRGEANADALAPILFNPNPRSVLDYVDSLGRRQLEQQMREQAFKRRGGLFGAIVAPGVALGSE